MPIRHGYRRNVTPPVENLFFSQSCDGTEYLPQQPPMSRNVPCSSSFLFPVAVEEPKLAPFGASLESRLHE
jgi:hypothetical protein